MPFAIVRSYIQDFSMEMLRGFFLSFTAAALALILSIAVSELLLRKSDAVHRFGAAFSNAGFIGIPLVQMVLGAEAVFYVASFVAILNFLQWTYGVLIMTGDRKTISLAKLKTNPILISFVVGMCLFLLPVHLPQPVMGMVGTIASMNGPLAMIVLGTYLAQVPLKDLLRSRDAYLCSLVRLLVIPALTVVLLKLYPGMIPEIRMAILLAAAAPVGSNVAIFAQLYDADYRSAVCDVCLSTLASIVTMPLIMGLTTVLW